jgi:hypothetical protein
VPPLPLALGDITADAIYGHQFALVIVERGDLLFGPDYPSVFAYPAKVRNLSACSGDRKNASRRLSVVGVDELQAQFGIGVVLLGGVAGYGGGRGADVLEARCRREPVAVDDVLGVLCEEPEALLALLQGLLCLLALGDVCR